MARATAKIDQTGPRRSTLVQERARRTRHEIVRAALALWNERGFEEGIDDTTVEEIAQAAGVAKATFYFHFSHKEEILLEMGLETADAMMKDAEAGMRKGRPAPEILHALMASLARRVERAPTAAVIRSISELSRRAYDLDVLPAGAVSFATAFAAVAAYGVQRGDLAGEIDPENFGAVLQAVTMDTVVRWAQKGLGSLRGALDLHTDLVIEGAAAVYPARSARPSRRAAGG